MKRTHEFLDFRAANCGVVPTFRLNVQEIESKFVFFDNTIYAAISRLSDCFPRISKRPSISNGSKKSNNEPLEKIWRTRLHSHKNF